MSIKTKNNNITGNMFWGTALKGRNISARGNALGLNTTTQFAPLSKSQKSEKLTWGNSHKSGLLHQANCLIIEKTLKLES